MHGTLHRRQQSRICALTICIAYPRDCDLYWRLPRSHNEGDKVDWDNVLDLGETPFVIKKINVYAWTDEDSGTSELRPCHAILGLL
ncbi:hypothetical protein EXIGLDRAFT_724863 [Exidia glandulosa HHB12029]|uniref:Uncharacterized protein n=1 Tax=Exidia glandulosa HHB12029 TaxID=1314781 RepID=A0A165E9A7_EXIGL|nr:hypothetical protein EXIGLDRAFT_724863 [Exidia glandulosa HHB12029]